MKKTLVLTVVCPDRPGIVEQFTAVILRHGGNWEESRMARLGGDFAGIVKIGVEPGGADALIEALRAETARDMFVFVKPTSGEALVEAQRPQAHVLRIHGADHEGIVHSVTHHLAARQVNVEGMETGVTPAPVSGQPLFHMEARIVPPAGLSIDMLARDLERICHEQGVEIDITPDA